MRYKTELRDSNHKLHSHAEPAVVTSHKEVWYSHGKKHRKPGEGPAFTRNLKSHRGLCMEWWYYGQRHRDYDQPAEISSEGMSWYQKGKLHRDNDLPTIISSNGDLYWHKHGIRHRTTGPAVIKRAGTDQSWYHEGSLHRIGGPARTTDQFEAWYQHGLLHREDGPAMKYTDGTHQWYKRGRLHRTDGPAIEHDPDAKGFNAWYINDERLDTVEVNEWLHNNNITKFPMTKDIQSLFLMVFDRS